MPEKAGVRILRYVPVVLFIQVPDANWIVPGLTRPGLYPIVPTSKIWYLDKSKKNPVLSVSRRQFPIGPAFGITSHSSQCQTLTAAIIDLVADDPILCYVALSRVRSSSDLLIYQHFPKEILERGDTLGPTFLLKRLGEKTSTHITTRHLISMQVAATCVQCGCQDYHHIASSDLPNPPPFTCNDCAHDATKMKFCNRCGPPKPMPSFSPSQWQMPFEERRCKQCYKEVANKVICPSCRQQRMASEISARGTCNRCTKVTCPSCQQEHMESEISARGTCNRCTKVTCPSCQQERMESEITARGTCKRCTKVICPSCLQERMASKMSARGTCNRCTKVTCPSCQQDRMESDTSARGTCNRCTKVTCASCQQERIESEITARGTCKRCTNVTCPSCQQERMASEMSARGTYNRCTKVTCPSRQQERMESKISARGTCN